MLGPWGAGGRSWGLWGGSQVGPWGVLKGGSLRAEGLEGALGGWRSRGPGGGLGGTVREF